MIAETISSIGRSLALALALISRSATGRCISGCIRGLVSLSLSLSLRRSTLYRSREKTWPRCIERRPRGDRESRIRAQGPRRKIPLIASMVINFPLAMHDSSLRLWPARVRPRNDASSVQSRAHRSPFLDYTSCYVNFQFNKVYQEVIL